jgi:hypothetical protein
MAKTLSDLEKRIAERSAELRTVLQSSQKSLGNIKKIFELAGEEGIKDDSLDRLVNAMQQAVSIVEDAVNQPLPKK